MKAKIKYTDGPIGAIKIVPDFLLPPEKLTIKIFLAQGVQFTDTELVVSLVDGRKLIVPLEWFPRLKHATKAQLGNFKILGDGEGIHWPELDEDLNVEDLIMGSHEDA